MTLPCVEPLPLYCPRDPQASDLWRLMDRYFPTFQQVYDERFQFSARAEYDGIPCADDWDAILDNSVHC